MALANQYNPEYHLIDKASIAVSDFMQGLSDFEGQLQNDVCSMSIERILLDMPFELEVKTGSRGDIVLGSSPPTQKIETSFMPVFHRIKMNIEVTHKSDEE
jgi:hypothetical protein